VTIRPHLIYKEVHRDFARCFSFALDPVSFGVNDDHVFRLDESLIANRGRAHDVTVGQARADVAVRRSHIGLFVDEMTESRNLRAEFFFRHGRAFYTIIYRRAHRPGHSWYTASRPFLWLSGRSPHV